MIDESKEDFVFPPPPPEAATYTFAVDTIMLVHLLLSTFTPKKFLYCRR